MLAKRRAKPLKKPSGPNVLIIEPRLEEGQGRRRQERDRCEVRCEEAQEEDRRTARQVARAPVSTP